MCCDLDGEIEIDDANLEWKMEITCWNAKATAMSSLINASMREAHQHSDGEW
jgi:hypothetical protein